MRFFFIYLFCRCGWYFIPACEGKNITYPLISGIINIKSAPYNAVGDGVINDTAFQAALTPPARATRFTSRTEPIEVKRGRAS